MASTRLRWCICILSVQATSAICRPRACLLRRGFGLCFRWRRTRRSQHTTNDPASAGLITTMAAKSWRPTPLSLEDIRVRLSLTLEREATLLGDDGHKRLIVGGLAQGAEAALHAVLMHHQVLAGYVGVCGNLLPCTLPEGPGKVKLHFFDYGERDPKVWVHQTRDPLLKHHDLTEHGAIFDNGVEGLPKDFRKGHLQGG